MATDELPNDRKYAKTHEWAKVEGDTIVIGITAYAAEELGDVVFLDLPWDDVGSRDYQASVHFGDIESVKATSELFCPAGGELVDVNEMLRDQPELVNSAPYTDGWMIKLKLNDPAQLDALMDADAYESYTASLH